MAAMSTTDKNARSHGDAAWAQEQIRAGAQVRKAIWPAGPWVEAGPSPDTVVAHGIEGANEPLPLESLFRADEAGDVWEHHPPRFAVPTLYAPIAWILYLFPALGGRPAFDAVVNALSRGTDFSEILLKIWRDAGREAHGRALVAALARLDRGLFNRSLAGDVRASLVILDELMKTKPALEPTR